MSLVSIGLGADALAKTVTHGAAAGGVTVDFDWTIVVQIAIFLFLWVVLKPLLFDPMLKLFEERERRIEGAIKQARDIDMESIEAKTKYESAMDKARAAGNAERERLKGEGLKKESELLGKVREETQAKMDAARRKAAEEATALRGELRKDQERLAKDLATRVLGREVSG